MRFDISTAIHGLKKLKLQCRRIVINQHKIQTNRNKYDSSKVSLNHFPLKKQGLLMRDQFLWIKT